MTTSGISQSGIQSNLINQQMSDFTPEICRFIKCREPTLTPTNKPREGQNLHKGYT